MTEKYIDNPDKGTYIGADRFCTCSKTTCEHFPMQHNEEKKCTGNCPNTCKVHMGEYEFCTNAGCICHQIEEKEEDWEKAI